MAKKKPCRKSYIVWRILLLQAQTQMLSSSVFTKKKNKRKIKLEIKKIERGLCNGDWRQVCQKEKIPRSKRLGQENFEHKNHFHHKYPIQALIWRHRILILRAANKTGHPIEDLLAFMSHKSCSPQFALILTSLFWQASEEEKLPNQREVDLTIDANYTARLHQRCERIKVVTTIRGRVTTTMRELESLFFSCSHFFYQIFL